MIVCNYRMMWAAGILAALSSITYPAISSFVSVHADPDKQGEWIVKQLANYSGHNYITIFCNNSDYFLTSEFQDLPRE